VFDYSKGVRRFDALYSEPIRYAAGAKTAFSDEAVTEVRQVVGYEGAHITDTSRDVLIIGAGYNLSMEPGGLKPVR
jgi:hypothetical protein